MKVVCWFKDRALTVDKEHLRSKNFSVRPCWSEEKHRFHQKRWNTGVIEEQYEDYNLVFIRKIFFVQSREESFLKKFDSKEVTSSEVIYKKYSYAQVYYVKMLHVLKCK